MSEIRNFISLALNFKTSNDHEMALKFTSLKQYSTIKNQNYSLAAPAESRIYHASIKHEGHKPNKAAPAHGLSSGLAG